MKCKSGIFVNVFYRNLVQLYHAVMFVFKLAGNDMYPAYLKVSIPMMENILNPIHPVFEANTSFYYHKRKGSR